MEYESEFFYTYSNLKISITYERCEEIWYWIGRITKYPDIEIISDQFHIAKQLIENHIDSMG